MGLYHYCTKKNSARPPRFVTVLHVYLKSVFSRMYCLDFKKLICEKKICCTVLRTVFLIGKLNHSVKCFKQFNVLSLIF